MYGMPPMMDRYGLGLPMGPGTMVCMGAVLTFRYLPANGLHCWPHALSFNNYINLMLLIFPEDSMITCLYIFIRDQGLASFLKIRFKRKAQVCQSWTL